MKKTVLLLIAALLPLGLNAQTTWRGGFEFGTGPSAAVFKVSGSAKDALGSACGSNYFLRYTHYVKGDFGIYAEVRDVNVWADEYSYFGALNKADGQKYRYRFERSNYDLSYNSLLTIGGAYKLPYNAFNLVFRAGIGYAPVSNNYSYYRQPRDGSTGSEYYFVSSTIGESKSVDYLIDSDYYSYYSASALVFSASAQFVLKTKSRIYLFGEAGFDCSPSRYDISTSFVGQKINYNPINYVEAVAYADQKDYWVTDYDSKIVTAGTLGLPVHFNLLVGIGLNFWKNK